MGGEVTHPSVGEMASIAKRSNLGGVPLVGTISLTHGGLDGDAERVFTHVGRISARAEGDVDGGSGCGNTPGADREADREARWTMVLRGRR